MTDYAYKLVSLNMHDQIDWASMKRARDKGWEPVPLDEIPDPVPNPLDMTPEQMANFKLCRMPEDKRDTMVAERERLNAALDAKPTHHIIALYKAERRWPEIGRLLARHTWINDKGDEEGVELRVNDFNIAGAKIAYDWLNKRGLA